MGDLAKIVQEPRGLMEKYMARFKFAKAKCAIVTFKKDCVMLVQDGLLWILRNHFILIKFIRLYHLSFDMVRYEKARARRIFSKTSNHNSTYNCEAIDISAQEVYRTDSYLTKSKE